MTFSTGNPIIDPVPDSVSLTSPPLTGVLVQISFPEILSIADKYFVGEFQERIRSKFPFNFLDQNITLKSLIETSGSSTIPNWRFIDESRFWRVSLSTSFLAIETRRYSGRKKLIQCVTELVDALSATVKPDYLTRVGVRYVDHVHGEPFEKLRDIVRPEVLGVISSKFFNQVDRASSEFIAQTENGSLVARWGFMPSGQTHNPELMPATDLPSWYLDTDVFRSFDELEMFGSFDFEKATSDLASQAYGFFRWVVNDDFLRLYGGSV